MPDISVFCGLPLMNWIAYATYLAIFLIIMNFNSFLSPLRLIVALVVMGYCLLGGIVYYNMGSFGNFFLYWGIGGAAFCFLTSPYWLAMIGLSIVGGCWFLAGCVVGGFFFGPVLWVVILLRVIFGAFRQSWLTAVIGCVGVFGIGVMGQSHHSSNVVINFITNPQLTVDQHVIVNHTEELHVHQSENTVNVLIEVKVVQNGDVLVTRQVSGSILQGMYGVVERVSNDLNQSSCDVRLTTDKGLDLIVKARSASGRFLKVGDRVRVSGVDEREKVVLVEKV